MQSLISPARRLTLTWAVVALGVLTLTGACTSDPESARWARGEAVGRLVAELLQQKTPVQSVNLADLTPFRWDRLYIFAPHTSSSAVEEALGRPWSGAERSGIARVDTAALLVFVAGDDIVAATMHPREYGDFVPVAGTSARSQAQALFRVERPAEGSWLMRDP
ncbi:MAG: hypothetical protein ACYC2G_08830 [Gemmatimonadaceae bacterium]